MSIPGGPDPTLPVGGPGAPAGADPTMPVTSQVPGGYGGPGGPTGGRGYSGGGNGDDDRRRLWFIAGGVLLGGILVGVLIALLAGGGGGSSTSDTTTSSSSSTSTSSTSTSTSVSTSSTSTTTTTLGPGPQVTSYTAEPPLVICAPSGPGSINLSWATTNTTGVAISIDGPGTFGNYGATDTQAFPYTCPGPHTYVLTAMGQNGQKITRQIILQSVTPPTT